MKTQTSKTKKMQRFWKSLLEGGSYLFAAVSVLFILLAFYGDIFIDNLIVAIVFALIFVALRVGLSTYFDSQEKQRNSLYKFFFGGLKGVVVIVLLIGIWGVYEIITNSQCGPCAVYQAIGLGIVVIWSCVFLSYFIWAIYFYNINLGLTEDEWDKIHIAREKKLNGENYSVDDINEEPAYNPYKDETFGLPPGTVRGMIAFTLLFGAIAMLIVSIGMKNEIDTNAMFWDQYEFFKTAFLMMIAFYFGSRSLQYLQNRNQPFVAGSNKKINQQNAGQAANLNIQQNEQNEKIPVIDPMENAKASDIKQNNIKQEPGTDKFDPMKPQS